MNPDLVGQIKVFTSLLIRKNLKLKVKAFSICIHYMIIVNSFKIVNIKFKVQIIFFS